MVSSLGKLPQSVEQPDDDSIDSDESVAEIKFSDDLKANEPNIHLPIVQCRFCRATGWACVKHITQRKFLSIWRLFYSEFFSEVTGCSFSLSESYNHKHRELSNNDENLVRTVATTQNIPH